MALWEVAASLLVVMAALLMAVRTRQSHGLAPHALLRDFATLDAGAACLREGCSPYDVAALDRMVVERGHAPLTNWALELPIYPPTTIALFVPFSFLSMAHGSEAMFMLTLVVPLVVGFACFVRGSLLADVPPLVRALLFAFLLASGESRFALLLGNPILLSVALLLFCCLDTAPSRQNLRVVLFSLACLLKPQVALPFLLPLLVKPSDGWRTVLRAVGCMAVFTAAVLAWCAVHPATAGWVADLHRELTLGAAAGNSMDPAARNHVLDILLNVEYLLGYWMSAPQTRAVVAAIVWLALGAGLVLGAWRARTRTGRTSVLLVTAATAAWTLLPVYHRFYDSLLLLLALPFAVVAIVTRERWLSGLGVLLIGGVVVLQWFHRSPGIAAMDGLQGQRSVGDFLLHRLDSAIVLVFCAALVGALLAYRGTADAE